MARPCRRTFPIHPLVADTARAPADGVANISPVAQGACRTTAMNGNSAPGYAKIIADRSARYEPSRSLRLTAYRSPTRISRGAGPDSPASRSVGGSDGSRPSRTNDTANPPASSAYTSHGPGATASTPPSDEPTSTLMFWNIDSSADAAVICSNGTIRGVAASNAGRCSDANAIITADTTNRGHTAGWGRSALSSSSPAQHARPGSHQRISARRSNRSASTPPYSPKTMSGTSSAIPSSPTISGDPVSCLAWTSSATSAAWDPSIATVRLANTARNSREPRSGDRSGRSSGRLNRSPPASARRYQRPHPSPQRFSAAHAHGHHHAVGAIGIPAAAPGSTHVEQQYAQHHEHRRRDRREPLSRDSGSAGTLLRA